MPRGFVSSIASRTSAAMAPAVLIHAVFAAALLSAPSPASADCQADSGSVENIIESGVEITCDSNEPNPYLGGIGTTATTTDVTVRIETDAEVISSDVGVALENGGLLDNDGTLRAEDAAVTATDSNSEAGITVANSGIIRSTDGPAIQATIDRSEVSNSGEIIADDTAVSLGSNGDLTNTGRIVSGNAVAVTRRRITARIENSGRDQQRR